MRVPREQTRALTWQPGDEEATFPHVDTGYGVVFAEHDTLYAFQPENPDGLTPVHEKTPGEPWFYDALTVHNGSLVYAESVGDEIDTHSAATDLLTGEDVIQLKDRGSHILDMHSHGGRLHCVTTYEVRQENRHVQKYEIESWEDGELTGMHVNLPAIDYLLSYNGKLCWGERKEGAVCEADTLDCVATLSGKHVAFTAHQDELYGLSLYMPPADVRVGGDGSVQLKNIDTGDEFNFDQRMHAHTLLACSDVFLAVEKDRVWRLKPDETVKPGLIHTVAHNNINPLIGSIPNRLTAATTVPQKLYHELLDHAEENTL